MPKPVVPELALGLLITLGSLLGTTTARAHGSFPEARQILLPADRPEQIILATTFGLIFSEDSGRTWQFSCDHGLSAYAASYLLAAPSSHRIFAMSGTGLSYSDDDACGWQAAGGVLRDVVPYAFTIDPSNARRVYAIGVPRKGVRTGDNIYVSDDGGVSFGEPVFTSPERSAVLTILVAPSAPNRLYATMFSTPENHPILLRSDDSGEHWDVAADLAESLGESPFELLAIDPLDEDSLYVKILEGSAETLATSEDGGLSFVRAVSIPGKLNAFSRLASGTILVAGTVGTEARGYRSTDGGRSFQPWLAAPHVHALAERDGKLYVAADNFADGYAIAESDDEGAHVTPLAGFEQVQAVKSCVAELCTESCAYYAGTGLWPASMCPVPTAMDPVSGGGEAAAGGADSAGENGGASGASPQSRGDEAGSPGLGEDDDPAPVRVSGGGCACELNRARGVADWSVLLVGACLWASRRNARRAKSRAY